MRVQEITEQYELDHDLNITNHLQEQKNYKIKSYRGFKLSQLDNHEPNMLMQSKSNNKNNQKEHSKNNDQQPIKQSMNNCEQKNARNDKFKPQSYPMPVFAVYKQRKNSEKGSSPLAVVLIMVAVVIVALILVETLFPESQFNVLKKFKLGLGENRTDGSL